MLFNMHVNSCTNLLCLIGQLSKNVALFKRYQWALYMNELSFFIYIYDFSDANWTSNPNDHHSISGFMICLGSNLISWSLKK